MDGLTTDEGRILGRMHAECEELRERVADTEEKLRKAEELASAYDAWIVAVSGACAASLEQLARKLDGK